jgi:hypothetical protein
MFIACAITTGKASAQDSVHQVYERVAATYQLSNNRNPPILRVKVIPENSPYKGAYFDPEAREVILDQRLADHLMQEPALGADALAFILGHELGHYYGDHAWLAGTAQAPTAKEGVARRRSLEEFADSKGLLHAHLAGYRGAAVAPAAIHALYTLYNLKPQLEGYPSREERVAATARVAKELRPLLPLYPLAISLIAGRNTEEASLVLKYLADKFQSPDLLHNAAVLQAMLGLGKSTGAARYATIYPFILSTENNLAASLRGSRGGDADPRPHIRKATRELERLLDLRPIDPAIRINLALLYDLSDRRKEGLELLDRDEGFTPKMQTSRLAAKAILLHRSGRTVQARQTLAKVKDVSNRPVWEAFFLNQNPPKQRFPLPPEAPCPPLAEIAERAGYGSSTVFAKERPLQGLGRVAVDSYDLSVKVANTGTAYAAQVRSHQLHLSAFMPEELSKLERQTLRDFAQQTPPSFVLSGAPITYRSYDNSACRFVLGMRDNDIVELILLK